MLYSTETQESEFESWPCRHFLSRLKSGRISGLSVCVCVCVCVNQESSGGSILPIYCGLLRVIGMDLYISTSRRRKSSWKGRRTVSGSGGGGERGELFTANRIFLLLLFLRLLALLSPKHER